MAKDGAHRACAENKGVLVGSTQPSMKTEVGTGKEMAPLCSAHAALSLDEARGRHTEEMGLSVLGSVAFGRRLRWSGACGCRGCS